MEEGVGGNILESWCNSFLSKFINTTSMQYDKWRGWIPFGIFQSPVNGLFTFPDPYSDSDPDPNLIPVLGMKSWIRHITMKPFGLQSESESETESGSENVNEPLLHDSGYFFQGFFPSFSILFPCIFTSGFSTRVLHWAHFQFSNPLHFNPLWNLVVDSEVYFKRFLITCCSVNWLKT